jgi:hypothetical protein
MTPRAVRLLRTLFWVVRGASMGAIIGIAGKAGVVWMVVVAVLMTIWSLVREVETGFEEGLRR